ncbi:hypothetical protein E2C01_010599 [Portunus trituberculatus]|uniref:Uncharacterized protein n=1 Tax=Portunus trituberculatus TaxID=210409 RepID=A0A5B7D967_PORTR|nr:hypothetical protein [Portunus trituberculatus]
MINTPYTLPTSSSSLNSDDRSKSLSKAIVIKEDVLRLEITMDDALAMNMSQCLKQLPHNDPAAHTQMRKKLFGTVKALNM